MPRVYLNIQSCILTLFPITQVTVVLSSWLVYYFFYWLSSISHRNLAVRWESDFVALSRFVFLVISLMEFLSLLASLLQILYRDRQNVCEHWDTTSLHMNARFKFLLVSLFHSCVLAGSFSGAPSLPLLQSRLVVSTARVLITSSLATGVFRPFLQC